ncbi:bacterial extracellular solute-binding protein-domain-containing protein [Cladochytrium replicatum]|nr:bacterial extracellular solute-binding protein-domain-containing protein [Cladochytrium replicatum]
MSTTMSNQSNDYIPHSTTSSSAGDRAGGPVYHLPAYLEHSATTAVPTSTTYDDNPKKVPTNRRRLIVIIVGVALLVIAGVVIGVYFGVIAKGSAGLVLTLQAANTKQDWLTLAGSKFNDSKTTVNGQAVSVNIAFTGSNLSSTIFGGWPDAWSPQNVLWVNQVTDYYKNSATKPPFLISGAKPDCLETITTPIGVAMWRTMAEALGWPGRDIGWKDLVTLAEQGWSSVGRNYGDFRLGYGHPEFSNSGRLTIVAAIYALANQRGNLAPSDINNATIAAIQKISFAVQHMGTIETDLLDRMARRGMNYLHAVSTYEANVINFNRNNPNSTGLVFIYPADGTFWSENPLCVITADATKAEAIKSFRNYLRTTEVQKQAIVYGFRPTAIFSNLSLTADVPQIGNLKSPFIDTSLGVLSNKTQETVKLLPLPDPPSVMDLIINAWKTVKKPSVTVLVIDTSGSMNTPKNGIVPINALIPAAQSFISNMLPQDYLILIPFSSTYSVIRPSGATNFTDNPPTIADLSPFSINGTWRGEALAEVGKLQATGATLLYDTTKYASSLLTSIRDADVTRKVRRNYGIVLMTDGKNDNAKDNSNDAAAFNSLLQSLPDGTESDQVHIFCIGYGDDADVNVLTSVANRTNGKYYSANTVNVGDIYRTLSLEY